jgi:hypothetical protein
MGAIGRFLGRHFAGRFVSVEHSVRLNFLPPSITSGEKICHKFLWEDIGYNQEKGGRIMSAADLFDHIVQLPLEEQRALIDRVWWHQNQHLISAAKEGVERPNDLKPRVMDLQKGMYEMAEDFDDPLPDEFWNWDHL